MVSIRLTASKQPNEPRVLGVSPLIETLLSDVLLFLECERLSLSAIGSTEKKDISRNLFIP